MPTTPTKTDQRIDAINPLEAATTIIERIIPFVAERQRTLVIFGILLLGVLAPVVMTGDGTTRTIALVGAIIAVVALGALAVLVIGKTTADDIRRAVEATNGLWWQLVDNEGRPGLTLLRVELSTVCSANQLFGKKFDPEGNPLAAWRSTSVAFQNIARHVLFYSWEGWRRGQASTVSGVGTYSFWGDDERADDGRGWFVTGDLDKLDFSDRSAVVLRRVTKEEAEIFEAGGESRAELIRETYKTMFGQALPTP